MKWAIITIFCALSSAVISQDLMLQPTNRVDSMMIMDTIIHRTGDKSLSLTTAVFNHSFPFGAGIRYRAFLGSKFSLDTDIMISNGYYHFGPGVIGLPLWTLTDGMEFESFDEFILAIVAGLISLEHMAFHIPRSKTFEIIPYISLARIHNKYYLNETEFSGFDVSIVMGCEWSKYKFNKNWSSFIEVSKSYTANQFRFSAGFTFGWMFFKK